MSDPEMRRAVEAIVLAATEPVHPTVMAQLLELPVDEIDDLCSELAAEYEAQGRGFQMARVAGGYRFQTHPDAFAYVERFVLDGQTARLSGPALETLAIVAYKQPVSRVQLSAIRGVNVDATLKTLVARGYVEELGHDNSPGNPVLFGTTRLFLERLGLDSLDELPALADFVPDSSIVEALERGLRLPADAAEVTAEGDEDEGRGTGELRGTGDGRGGGRGQDRPLRKGLTEGERLQKVLARAGVGSRRVSEELIAAGRVTVNGDVATLGRRVDPAHDHVALDGVPVVVDSTLVHWLLNKPAGYVTTARDPQGRATVFDLVPAEPRVFSVGRLDLATEGLLVMTNDGELAQLLTHPSHGVEKEYFAEVDGTPAPGALRALREGIDLDDGPTQPAQVRLVQHSDRGTTALEIVVKEGRKRMVRRMCSAVGHPVRRLVRTRIGPVRDAKLAPGAWRVLQPDEVRGLYAAALDRPAPRRRVT